jgi:hypothetical protein
MAAAAIEPNSDILGLNLTMSQDQAKDYVSTSYKGSPIKAIVAQLQAADYSQDVVAGFVFDATLDGTGKGNTDRVAVIFNPSKGASDIFAISRHVQYVSQVTIDDSQRYHADGTLILKQVLLDSLVKKYGPPIKTDPGFLPGTQYIWASGARAVGRSNCVIGSGNRSSYYFEPFYSDGSADSAADAAGSQFVTSLNNLQSSATGGYGKCGVILRVNLDLLRMDNNQDSAEYVKAMSEEIIDLSKGDTEMRAFAKAFFSAASKATSVRVGQDAKNAPKL